MLSGRSQRVIRLYIFFVYNGLLERGVSCQGLRTPAARS
jgi:hypothetical protein